MADIRFVTKENLAAVVAALKASLANQDVFSTVKVGNVDVAADGVSDVIEFVAGTNITITADATNDTVTIAATDTTYDDVVADATGTADSGLMTSADKAKLDGIAEGAEVNQNAFSNIVIGATTIEADGKTDTVTIAAGTNVTITPDAATDTITITAADTTYTLEQDGTDGHILTFTPSVGQATEITIPDNDTTYDPAVASVSGVGGTDGLLTAVDKEKLDGIAEGAQVNVLEGVKVNGTALTATNKVVDVTVETGDAGVGTVKVNGVNVTPYGLGTAAAATVETVGIASNTTTLATTAQVKAFVDATVASAYKAAGTIAAAGLTSALLVAANEGNVYSLTDELSVTSANAALFKDATAGETFPEGSNVAVIKDGNDYLFDVLPGFIDLSPYLETANIGGLTAEEVADIIATPASS